MKKRILVVDDQKINRGILTQLLSSDYEVVCAENGQQALELLREKYASFLSAVILDLIMPVMDGYEFLAEKDRDEKLRNIPTIVTTSSDSAESEKKALCLGAWDFVVKPYDAAILKLRLQSVIARSQMTAFERIKYLAEYDTLTGIFNKGKFCTDTRRMLETHREQPFTLIQFDIDHFKMYNSFFGTERGDELLRFIADYLKRSFSRYPVCTYGRMDSDLFAVCLPVESRTAIEETAADLKRALQEYRSDFILVPSAGVYMISDRTLPIEGMLDRASIAAKSVKGRFSECCAFFEDTMQQRLEKEQQIINEMREALTAGQFKVYLQPQIDLQSGRPCGAEALVRWEHPRKGVVSPGLFISVFEHNGFIVNLDRYIWEEVCRGIRRWMDAGVEVPPISVNVSRIDLYNPRLPEDLKALVEKYNILPSCLNLEITESVFTENTEALNRMVCRFRDMGFLVLMDDFGSGYSSLNVLKDVDVDVLKIDMRFLSNTQNEQKSRTIISAVVQMAREIGISVVTEGVETQEQADFLRSIGCNFAQGYLFSEPVTLEQYELLLQQSDDAREQNS
jgi:diguanylate cyclase (GGDEF)-like protein